MISFIDETRSSAHKRLQQIHLCTYVNCLLMFSDRQKQKILPRRPRCWVEPDMISGVPVEQTQL